jgi:pilus assembly protein CpaB
MNKRFLGVLGFAFVVASVFSFGLYRVLINRPQQANAAPSSVQILLASKDIEVGTLIKEDDVRLTDWPGAAPAGAETKPQDVVGRGVTTTIFAKEPVIESRLAPKGAGGGLAAMIPPGMRAFAVRVNEVIGVSGFVVAGMHVDVLISGNKPGGSTSLGTLSKTLMQNIEVLSAGQDFKKDVEGKPVMTQTVNLCVTPEQAEQLSLASNQTVIQLVLRNPMDREVAKTPGTALEYLFTGVRPKAEAPAPRPKAVAPPEPPKVAAAPPKKEQPFVMEIVQGNKRTEAKFESSGEGK